MAARKSFLLRVPPELYSALEKWAADELRSVNGQMEYLLAQAVKDAGRTARLAQVTSPEEPTVEES